MLPAHERESLWKELHDEIARLEPVRLVLRLRTFREPAEAFEVLPLRADDVRVVFGAVRLRVTGPLYRDDDTARGARLVWQPPPADGERLAAES